MTSAKSIYFAISLILLSSISSAISIKSINDERAQSTPSIISENNWVVLHNPSISHYQISEATGLIHSPFGKFDPLTEPSPLGPWEEAGLSVSNDGSFFIVQSHNSDLQELEDSLNFLGIQIIDHFPDDSVVISIAPGRTDDQINTIRELNQVRWIDNFPAMWKISSSLYPLMGLDGAFIDLDITPSPSNSPVDLSNLERELFERTGELHLQSHCDKYLCKVKSAQTSLISSLATDSRVLRVEMGPVLTIHNSNASIISGVDYARSLSELDLRGEGEVIGISDTGLDVDHGDFGNRLRNPIYNLFGPDSSGADSNSGHGTHVAATLLGDGTGDPNSTGIVPESTFHFYQLEVDSSGILARWGSLYDMFEHSFLNDANIHTNSWGSESLVGEYTSDSRSIDLFTNDYPEMLVIFSSGDMSNSGVASPSTAKNSLTVGASTTGAFGSQSPGHVYDESSTGPTSDGRIKPELVAPGVMICSARAQEAGLTTGGICSESMHSDGTTPLYMTLSGSSMAAPVVAGASAMARQFLREEVGLTSPSSDLIRAILVNGAEDIGELNVPNSGEGWGQLNISNSIFPRSNGINQTLFLDQDRNLLPGHGFIYTFEVSGNNELDATLSWNDREGSASADQNTSRLVNNLDLVVTSPSGEEFNGNDFANGFSQSSGNIDNLNNLERVKIASTESGIWTVKIGHSGGFSQDFSLVVSSNAIELQEADLTVVPNSIFSSETSPLKGDTISMQLSWINQAAAPTGQYSISLEDMTDGNEIGTYSMPSLQGGQIETFSIYHSFQSTGTHLVRLTLDYLSQVDELNDETSGMNNNIFDLEFNVTEIGVRIVPLMEDGSNPADFVESQSARNRDINPSTESWANFQLELLNEGTSEITVELSISAVQEIDDSGIMVSPQDEWSETLSDSGPWVLSPSGESGDRVLISLNLTDEDADIESRFALPGHFVTDLILYDKMAPTISHSVRLSVDIDRVEGLYTVPAGTEDLGAEPNEFALFTLSVRNIGNGPTEYGISCETEDRWIVHVGSSQVPEVTIGPLSRLQFVPVPIRVKVPPSSSGILAGDTNLVTCITTSVNDPSLETTETATVEVLESRAFSTQISDMQGNEFGPAAITESRAVQNGDTISTILTISNRGNIPLSFDVRALSSSNTWPIQVYLFDEDPPVGEVTTIETDIDPGSESRIIVRTIVPLASVRGDKNTVTIKTSLDDNIVTNATVLEVKEITTLDVQAEEGFSISLGRDGNANIFLHNSGNVPLLIELTLGTLPDGWSGGFLTGSTFSMDMNRDSVVNIALQLPSGTPSGNLSDKVPVIIKSTSPSLSTETITIEMDVIVLPSVWLEVQSETTSIQGITEGEDTPLVLQVYNKGNTKSPLFINHEDLDGWSVKYQWPAEELEPGDNYEITVSISPRKSAEDGLTQLRFYANSTVQDNMVTLTNSSLVVDVSKSKSSNQGGISGLFETLGLPAWTLALLFVVALGALISLGIKARKEFSPIDSDEELIPRGSALQAGSKEERRAAALDTYTTGDVVTGGVSESEINDTLQATIPTLPTHQVPEGAMPLPITGLPDGWSMEQWVAYGHLWWEQNGP
tara:strand:- start:3266 stop:8026 length:4761 start_codon:yes stop_codon:yes gene_type:complete